ncbi:MAG: permease-like cell division protein FtsX, partial [Bacteroidales bacterium]|nr:permease-like cell division protein FtsX [Bacteroidales bacterium]
LIGVATALILSAGRVSNYFKENIQISLLCAAPVSEAEAAACAARVDSLPFVRSTELIGKAQGEKELKEMLGEDFLSVFETAPIPVSINVGLKADYVCADSLAKIIPVLQAFPEVEEVESRQSLVEDLTRNLSGISAVLGIFIALLLFISFILIGNTVRLSLFARRFTIHTMRLVGATRGFIRRPFIRSAVVQGLVSGLLSCAVLAGALVLLHRSFPQIYAMFSTEVLVAVAAVVLLCGVLICVTATYFTVNKLALASEDSLYY